MADTRVSCLSYERLLPRLDARTSLPRVWPQINPEPQKHLVTLDTIYSTLLCLPSPFFRYPLGNLISRPYIQDIFHLRLRLSICP